MDRRIASEDNFRVLAERIDIELGKKPEPPEVHADKRQISVNQSPRLGEKRAIAAHDNGEVCGLFCRRGQWAIFGVVLADDVGVLGHNGSYIVEAALGGAAIRVEKQNNACSRHERR